MPSILIKGYSTYCSILNSLTVLITAKCAALHIFTRRSIFASTSYGSKKDLHFYLFAFIVPLLLQKYTYPYRLYFRTGCQDE